MAQGFWALLIPHGLAGGALAHVTAGGQDSDGDEVMASAAPGEGWKDVYTQWWFEFLEGSGAKGVSKDVWQMVSRPFDFQVSSGGVWGPSEGSWEVNGEAADMTDHGGGRGWFGWRLTGLRATVLRVCADDRLEVREVRRRRCVRRSGCLTVSLLFLSAHASRC